MLPIAGAKSPNDLNRLKNADGSNFDPADKNPNFGRFTAYQPPRIFRFGLRFTY